jgi:hypothetical protein
LEQFTFSIGSLKFYKESTTQNGCIYTVPPPGDQLMLHPIFTPTAGKKMFFSAWVRETCTGGTGQCPPSNYTKSSVKMQFSTGTNYTFIPAGPVVDGWQKVEGTFDVPVSAFTMTLSFINADNSNPIYFDDIRMHPFNSNMKSYVYDPTTLRLSTELDENNFATFYDYDEEGRLIRTKKETQQGIKTIQETRSATQKAIQTIQ